MSLERRFFLKDQEDEKKRIGLAIYYIFAIVLGLIMVIATIGWWRYLPAQVPLFYTLPWGEARLAGKQMLFLLPGLLFTLISLNWMIAKRMGGDELLPKTFAAASLLLAILLTVAYIGILQAVL